MRISFRTQLFKGVSVGFSRNLGSSKRRKNGPTQKELEKMEKSQFIENNYNRFTSLLFEYFSCIGYFIPPNEVYNYPLSSENKNVDDLRQEFHNTIRLINEGGNFTGKRKDIILESIYSLENIIQNMESVHPLTQVVSDYQDLSAKAKKYLTWIIILCVIVYGIPVSIYLFIKRKGMLEQLKNMEKEIKSISINSDEIE